MAKRPDLDALIVSKDPDEISFPVVPPSQRKAENPTPEGSKAYAHTLSYRMTSDQYRLLRRYVADQEEKTGKRVTHQSFIEEAVMRALKDAGK